jgi:4-alpha-glucanotransferase
MGPALREWATFATLAERHGARWSQWPEPLRRPSSRAVTRFAAAHAGRVAFHEWLQWLLDEQLRHAAAALPLVADVPVGVDRDGADAWAWQDVMALGASIGAPPDRFNAAGQDWGLPPFVPGHLRAAGYEPFIATLRAALRHAGGLRIDHVMGLFRLWCIPHGDAASQGAYLRYDYEAMVSILLLEAERAGAFVVGEDLGVVEPFVRDYLAGRGVLGTSILWFEMDGDRPRPPETWRELCLATVTTHDLPPTAGYLAGEHVRLRDSLGLLTRTVEEELAVSERERETFLAVLRDRGMLAEGASEEETVAALHELLTRSPSRLLGVMVSDLVGDRRTQNQPGTHREYPNWRVPLSGPDGQPLLLEDLPASARARDLAARLSGGTRRP